MDLTRLVTQFSYRIEPKPEGGFVAHASDPAVPPLEAPTRQELQTKIQQNILSMVSTAFPGLKLGEPGINRQFAFHVERTPDGSFAIHSADPNTDVVKAGTQEELESRFLEKLINFAGKHFLPQLAQAVAAQGNSASLNVVVNRKTAFTLSTGSHKISVGLMKDSAAVGSVPARDSEREARQWHTNVQNPDLSRLGGTFENSPITPESNKMWIFFRFVLALLGAAVLVYFFLLHR